MLAAHRPDIGSRVYAREAYGVGLTVPYNPEIHALADARGTAAYNDYATGKEVPFCFLPITFKGSPAEAIKHEGIIEIRTHHMESLLKLRVDIVRCTDETLADKEFGKAGKDIKNLDLTKVSRAYKIYVDIRRNKLKLRAWRGMYSIKYRIVPMWDGLTLLFFVVIHPSGDFPEGYEDFRYVKDCLVKRLELKDMKVSEVAEDIAEMDAEMDADGDEHMTG